MPKVSVCIPAYNQVKYLKKTIDSVLMQTYTDYEIVITDDSVTDIVKDFVSSYGRGDIIKYYKNPLKLGTPENWNEAIRKSSGEYIKILHHDDWLNYDDSLAKYVALLDNNPEVDFAFSATQARLSNGDGWVYDNSQAQLRELKVNPLLLYNANLIGAPSTSVVRRNPELQFDPKMKWQVDKEYYIRQVSSNNNVAYSPELLVVTFLAEGRVSDECINNKDVEIFEYLYLLEKIYGRRDSYTNEALKTCVLHSISICDTYEIGNTSDIRNCGYNGHIHHRIKTYLTLKAFSPSLGKVYLKFLRKF